jgi:hypothetical protein
MSIAADRFSRPLSTASSALEPRPIGWLGARGANQRSGAGNARLVGNRCGRASANEAGSSPLRPGERDLRHGPSFPAPTTARLRRRPGQQGRTSMPTVFVSPRRLAVTNTRCGIHRFDERPTDRRAGRGVRLDARPGTADPHGAAWPGSTADRSSQLPEPVGVRRSAGSLTPMLACAQTSRRSDSRSARAGPLHGHRRVGRQPEACDPGVLRGAGTVRLASRRPARTRTPLAGRDVGSRHVRLPRLRLPPEP